jgi:hypothetical protein
MTWAGTGSIKKHSCAGTGGFNNSSFDTADMEAASNMYEHFLSKTCQPAASPPVIGIDSSESPYFLTC